MRRLGNGLLLTALLALAGCHTEPYLKPPPHPDDYTTPPVEDSRFSQPPSYPKGTLFNDPGRKSGDVNGAGGPGGPRGGSARLNGPGGGY